MNIRPVQFIIGIHICGLSALTILELWRPGSVAGAVSVPFVWIIAVVLCGVATWKPTSEK